MGCHLPFFFVLSNSMDEHVKASRHRRSSNSGNFTNLLKATCAPDWARLDRFWLWR